MLLMGDGTTEFAPQAETTPIDELWGVGRMRMRLFTEPGMDAPWRWGFKIAELDHAQTVYQPLNYVRPQGNLTIPREAVWLRAALWFFEPNIRAGTDPSEIRYRVVASGGGPTYTCSSTAPQSQRLWVGPDLAAKTWTIEIYGQDIPASTHDLDPYYTDATRKIYSTFYWEDRLRDDPDGPGDEIY